MQLTPGEREEGERRGRNRAREIHFESQWKGDGDHAAEAAGSVTAMLVGEPKEKGKR